MKDAIKSFPVLGFLARKLYRMIRGGRAGDRFPGSAEYWEQRYSGGGDSGVGSYGRFADFKAVVVNDFVANHGVDTVMEFGSGDGNQLTLARYPKYLGFDVSAAAITRCRDLFRGDPTKSFRLYDEYGGERADLVLSLDVLYHLVEDKVFDEYMRRLFESSDRYVIIYASNTDDDPGRDEPHIRHRQFTAWIAANARTWNLVRHLPNRYPYDGDYRRSSFAEFFIYERT